ncbi:HNHc domain-containing protein [Vibrio chagasii]|uniref:HNH endonuclease n=1 Tax=Vibrio crassostreae TaxID=246167 RepID=UPI000F502C76|nr:HNH endonuclease signature motif containing protein [Vibrio crassostreae]CAH6845385.1 HNHc domain-containing protein [Vibrio chagasii]RPF15197.1 hypothetical protein EDB12_3432 [Vibrio crassostreae]CAH7023038.1 HNHc domain-containing protein [Vibrio chagasii]CAH7031383.1 HNHc domain-containing protein [Vibrio chagasii]CAH7087545.1 HNHc domain-containing protein [Vibrio chagasii]
MKKLTLPKLSHSEVLSKCEEGIARQGDKQRFSNAEQELIRLGTEYSDLATNGQLFSIQSLRGQPDHTVVVEPLTKKKLVRLYEYYLLDKKKPGRDAYETLLASTNEKCPMCGDIGRPRNLDHFLPKAHFPQYSILPINLIPCCRDCNMDGKGDDFATSEEQQLIHPYLDKNIFSREKWVSARYIMGDPGVLEYIVTPPDTWDPVDQNRAIKHFSEFDLENRFQIEAAKHISEVIDQSKALIITVRDLVPDLQPNAIRAAIRKTILKPILDNALFENHWKKVMYRALNDSEEFFENLGT